MRNEGLEPKRQTYNAVLHSTQRVGDFESANKVRLRITPAIHFTWLPISVSEVTCDIYVVDRPLRVAAGRGGEQYSFRAQLPKLISRFSSCWASLRDVNTTVLTVLTASDCVLTLVLYFSSLKHTIGPTVPTVGLPDVDRSPLTA